MSILFNKLTDTFNKKEIEKKFGSWIYNKLKSQNTNVCLYSLYKIMDLEKEINYTYEDCLKDYYKELLPYLEKKIVYRIWKTGNSIYAYSSIIGISTSNLYRLLKKGSHTVTEKIKYELLDTFEVEYDLKDFDNFNIIIHENFCKLIGKKEELEKIANKYEIDFPVLYHDEYYSIAFDGWLFRVIKENL